MGDILLNDQDLTASTGRVLRFLTGYLHAAGMSLEVHAEVEPAAPPDAADPILHVRFSGPDVPLLLDRQAELLNALEHLAAKLLGLSPEQHHRLRFDAAGYKSGRDQQLHDLAGQAIAEVTRSGHPFRLPPMNSRERRLVHLLIAAAGLRSASSGEGPFRSVTISTTAGSVPPSPDSTSTSPNSPAQSPATDARTARLRNSFRRR